MLNDRAKWLPGKPTQPGLYWWLPLSEARPNLILVKAHNGKLYAEIQTVFRHKSPIQKSVGAMAGRFSERLPGPPKTCDDPHCKDGVVLSVSPVRWVDCPRCQLVSEEGVKP